MLLALAAPLVGLRTSMPSITVVPADASARVGYTHIQQAFGPGMPGTLQIVAPADQAESASATVAAVPASPPSPRPCPPPTVPGWC
ncbi:putative membrane protein YdfJ with MMPL/SSD domain [Catenulispora sp. GP43]